MSGGGPAAPPAPYTREYRDTPITVWWQPAAVAHCAGGLVLETREFPKPAWARTPLPPAATAAGAHVVAGLYPNSTWEFRLRGVAADGTEGEAGPATAADTLAAGCVPKDDQAKKQSCVVA